MCQKLCKIYLRVGNTNQFLRRGKKMVDAISNKLTYLIQKNVADVNNEKAEIINFGIKSILSEVIKSLIIFTAAYFLGVLPYIIIALLSFGTYRTFAGGFHAKTQLKCLISNSSILFGIVFLSYIEYTYVLWAYGLIFIINCLLIHLYAPADVEERPIVSKKLRKRLKIQSYIVMSMIFAIALILIKDQLIKNILIYATLFESLSLLPISYKLMKCNHGCTNAA
jgi:accessory gene regulator B